VTINGNGTGPRQFHPNSVFVSKSHAANHGSAHFVHNGIESRRLCVFRDAGELRGFFGQGAMEGKNFAGALRVAQKAGLELRVLGSRNWPLGLQRLLPPSLCRGARYYGMLGGREKIEILSRSRCLILPVRWQEPFALRTPSACQRRLCLRHPVWLTTGNCDAGNRNPERKRRRTRRCLPQPSTLPPGRMPRTRPARGIYAPGYGA